MAEFIGTENSIAIQKRLRDRQSEISKSPNLVNGGRVLHFLDPDTSGWDHVRSLAEEDRLAGFPAVHEGEITKLIRENLGPHWRIPAWHYYQGKADRVLDACAAVIAAVPIPDDWRVSMALRPDEATLEAVQALNAETGVSPYPAYYMRSEAIPVLTGCIRDGAGTLIATASVADRYHPDGRLGGHMFSGMVSVSETQRGKGLGKLINALVIQDSHAHFGWQVATEQVAPDNSASAAMIVACGLEHRDGLVSVAAINSDERFSR